MVSSIHFRRLCTATGRCVHMKSDIFWSSMTRRIPITGGWDTIRDARRVFLHHPLALLGDVRIVSGSELHTIVYDMMKCMAASWRNEPLSIEILNNWQSSIDTWHLDWENIIGNSILHTYRLWAHQVKGQRYPAGGLERACNDVGRSFAYLSVSSVGIFSDL